MRRAVSMLTVRGCAAGMLPVLLLLVALSAAVLRPGCAQQAAPVAAQAPTSVAAQAPASTAGAGLMERPGLPASEAGSDGPEPGDLPPEAEQIAGAAPGVAATPPAGANRLAWAGQLIPATPDDVWIADGLVRYGQFLAIAQGQSHAGQHSQIDWLAAEALAGGLAAQETPARPDPARPDPAQPNPDQPNPARQNPAYGAMLFHMLRGMLGDEAFNVLLASLQKQCASNPPDGRPMTTADLVALASKAAGRDLSGFFAQWLQAAGAPRLVNRYSVYRLGNGRGFRIDGELSQGLPAFHMLVPLVVETDGRSETRTVDADGPRTPYSLETFGLPRRVLVDPEGWLLQLTPAVEARMALLRAQRLESAGKLAEAAAQFQQALRAEPLSSLVSYRYGLLLLRQHNEQAAADAFHDALRGDGQPRWTQVWSHIQAALIYRRNTQADRAQDELRQAIATGDNSFGALSLATRLAAQPAAGR